jgi:transcriptional regulator with PAS, ATPase and Fis domain
VKRLVVISGTEATRLNMHSQLEDLFEGTVRIESHATDVGAPRRIRHALVLLTSPLILDECKGWFDDTCDVMIARRTLDFANLDKLYALPEGSALLIVNDVRETALEVIELLKKVGFDQYRYQAYHPGCRFEGLDYDYIITPGETALVPAGAHNVIDIGSRILDITTILEIVQSLEVLSAEVQERIHLISARYMRTILSLGKELHRKHENLKEMNAFLVRMINSVTDGILSYDPAGNVRLINSLAARLLGLEEGANLFAEARARHRKLYGFLREDSLNDYLLHLDDADYVFSKIPSEAAGSRLLTIKNVRERINMENSLRKELKRQGYRAKYVFGDLVHASQAMKELIQKARKLAESEFNIMIYGESGTGKELLASAIHSASRRKDGPFLAVNFSALPDELIESELFGYEEGAFTGARKGGRVGLFELASQGTLFLDEIGDISPKIQSRLLRVLQEKEVLKVGGSKNIPVDVRVVAATNKDLREMVRKGTFREDLYYRLKKLYVRIPALRERREDILPLFCHFLIQKNGFDLKLTEDARGILERYDWPGNVRELESAVEYILAVREGDVIDRSMLSEDLLQAGAPQAEAPDRLTAFILRAIRRANDGRVLIGRKKLSELSFEAHFDLSEQRMRKALDDLAARGLVRMGRGKVGLSLAPAGRAFLDAAGNG